MKSIREPFFSEGTTPLDGDDPNVYSKVVPFHPFSFLRANLANTINPDEKKYLPKAPAPTYMDDALLHSKLLSKKDEILKSSCLVVDKEYGGVLLTDAETTAKQRSVFAEVLAKIGRSFFNSNIVGMSLPIRIMESRTDEDRVAEAYRVIGLYLCKAANSSDKLERLKLVSTAMVAQNYLMMRKQKSINPLLGETLQATISDGTQIYGEQVSHHPPTTYVYAVGPNRSYVSYGYAILTPSFKGNYMMINVTVKQTIRFKDGHQIDIVARPGIKIAGLIAGQSRALLKGMYRIEDRTLKLRSVIFFDYGEKKGFISSSKTVPKDFVEGIIYAPTGAAFNEDARRVADLDDVKKELARMKGSWLDKFEINSVNYWNIDKFMPEVLRYSGNPLPSDWRFREDLVWVRHGNVDIADGWKDALEIRQRRDRALREKFAKK